MMIHSLFLFMSIQIYSNNNISNYYYYGKKMKTAAPSSLFVRISIKIQEQQTTIQ